MRGGTNKGCVSYQGWALARLAAHSASLGMVKELAKESADETQNSSR